MNFDNYKFRCSSLPELMTNGRTKEDPATYLSETAKSMIREEWIKAVYGREKIITTPAMQKGIMVESDIIELIKTVTGNTYFKNKDLVQNDFIIGTPDIKAIDRVIDTKASQDIWTFSAVTEDKAKKDYFWQICGYAWTLKFKKGELNFGLVNTPDALIYDEYRKLVYQGGVKESEDGENAVRKLYTYDDIPAEKRLKRYEFDFSDEDFALIEQKVKLAREYMNTLSL